LSDFGLILVTTLTSPPFSPRPINALIKTLEAMVEKAVLSILTRGRSTERFFESLRFLPMSFIPETNLAVTTWSLRAQKFLFPLID
jgi:hypothetical protein